MKQPILGMLQFPGSNCDQDVLDAMGRHFGIELQVIWHKESALPRLDGLVIPGGFSYGDYLRAGALASLSPVLKEVKAHVARGLPVLGICNGFQILTETGILPGALLANRSNRFVCKYVNLGVGEGESRYQKTDERLCLPIAHGEGNFYIDPEGLKHLKDRGGVAYRYLGENPNGSVDDIAGIVSENGRVLGLMPHPERAVDRQMGGSDDGKHLLQQFLETCVGSHA